METRVRSPPNSAAVGVFEAGAACPTAIEVCVSRTENVTRVVSAADPGAWVVRGLQKLGLVWDVRYPTREMIDNKRKANTQRPAAETDLV